MRSEIERLEGAADKDPALAIGTAKDLVETCCKTILTARGVAVSPKADLPELTKLLAKELKLVPDDVASHHKGAETVRLILRNLTALTQYLAELRGLYGSGHGRDGRHRGLKPRHARLAIGAAVTFIDFTVATFIQEELREMREGPIPRIRVNCDDKGMQFYLMGGRKADRGSDGSFLMTKEEALYMPPGCYRVADDGVTRLPAP